ncbi:MAG: class I SAM-dependent methyltransferase [Elusimicrobia bacterium]|nr:class I SAM-dependent methyltransferase [Elusimicrobiota bacterium]
MVCRMCKGSGLEMFLDLGFTPPADQFQRKEQLREPSIYYPLQVAICPSCGLAQLSHVVSPEVLYRNDYPYESSITKTGHRHWDEFARSTTERFELGPKDLVVDIGSNVGVLLSAFKSSGVRVLGVDPAPNIVRIAEKRGIETVSEFFSEDVVTHILKTKGPTTVITATNVFAHVDDLDSFMQAVIHLLKEDGVFILEAPYFANLVKHLEYDTIYHEHLSYLSVKPLIRFFAKFGMEIFDIGLRDIHGGSFRVFVSRQGKRPTSPIVAKLLEDEEKMGLHDLKTLKQFSQAVENNRQELLWLLRSLKRKGSRIVGVSAPAKGMTLLNYCRIGTETLDFVTEKSTLKIGRYTPGTHIPVLSDDELIRQQPDYALLLAWNFADEIMENLKSFGEAGGKFIIPIPTPQVVDKQPGKTTVPVLPLARV